MRKLYKNKLILLSRNLKNFYSFKSFFLIIFLLLLFKTNTFSQNFVVDTKTINFESEYARTVKVLTFNISNNLPADYNFILREIPSYIDIDPSNTRIFTNSSRIFTVTVVFPDEVNSYSFQTIFDIYKAGSEDIYATINGPLIELTTIPQPPQAPSNFLASDITYNSCSLSWNKPSGVVEGYNVYKEGNKVNSSIIYPSNYTVLGLNSSTTYLFSVTAKNAGGESSKSNINVTTPPTTPTSLSVTNKTLNSFTLNWAASTGATGYYVYKDGEKIATVSTNSATISNLCPNTTYSLAVSAFYNAAVSPLSNPFSGTTLKYLISGVNHICFSNTTFTVENILPGSTIVWSKSDNNLSYVSGQGTNSYIVKPLASYTTGTNTISATISLSGCNSVPISKPVSIGRANITNSQINGGQDNVTFNSIYRFYITPAQGAGISYRWSITPYSMNCSSSLPTFTGSNTGTYVNVKNGTCAGQYILHCEAINSCGAMYYQDRAIKVYNPNGGGGTGGGDDPCATIVNMYPNPSKEKIITFQIQYPDPCDGLLTKIQTQDSELDQELKLNQEVDLVQDEERDLNLNQDVDLDQDLDLNQELELNQGIVSNQYNEIRIYDISGSLLYLESFDSESFTLNTGKLDIGIYFVNIIDKKGKIHKQKLTIN